ncbi:HTH domain-containing protein [Clostridium aestuarii]|uniref:HTH domain-containing protein n=1 Tax=Clostridium aestuarii TaxID=338193 RepID=A0ABT4CZN8_9CLOT|nr:HTH domain-containing protein [Clostridium aestuarii]MCY6484451.1 HTH domain-containing protein [Clostridium aestuarii]
MSKLSHLLELIIMLQRKELTTASEIAEIFNVDKKTIYRYVEALKAANIPVESKKGRYGGFSINKDFYIKYPKLDSKELEALLMAAKMLTREKGFFYADELQSAVMKIKNTVVNNKDEFKDTV